MNTPEHPAWIARIREQLDASAHNLDAAALARLNAARQAALAQHTGRRWQIRWMPAAGMLSTACALLLALGLWHTHRVVRTEPTLHATGDDLGIVAGAENLDMYEDLDFYAWLDAQDTNGD